MGGGGCYITGPAGRGGQVSADRPRLCGLLRTPAGSTPSAEAEVLLRAPLLLSHRLFRGNGPGFCCTVPGLSARASASVRSSSCSSPEHAPGAAFRCCGFSGQRCWFGLVSRSDAAEAPTVRETVRELSLTLSLPLSPSLSSPSAKLKRSECERARSPGPPRAHLLQLRAPAALAGRARADTFTCSGVKLMDMEISPTTGAEVPRDFSSRSRYSYPPARAYTHL